MSETLWITVPTNEENQLKKVIKSITDNLSNLTLNNLISYFEIKNNCEQGIAVDNCLEANKWQNILRNYSAIIGPTHLNTNTSEIKGRLNSIKNKFRQHGKIGLANVVFQPNELMCLLIMCYSNPSLIGPNLCKALDDRRNAKNNNNEVEIVNQQKLIKEEMLENSAYSYALGRVLTSQSNLRLMSTELFFNDTNIRLPKSVIDRVTTETIRDGRIVTKWDERGGFTEVIDGPARARSEGSIARAKRDGTEVDAYEVLQGLQEVPVVGRAGVSSTQSSLDAQISTLQSGNSNESKLTTEVLPLYATNNAASFSYGNALIIGSLALFQIARNSPVGAVVRNIGKDLVTASKHVGGFFSKNAECEAQEKTVLLSPRARS